MLIKTLAPLEITIGAASTEIPAHAITDVPPAIAATLRQADHATSELEDKRLPSDLPTATVEITHLDAADASTDGDRVRIAANRFLVASTYAIGTAPALANQRDVFRVNAGCQWVPATVAEAIIAAGAGERAPWFCETSADAGVAFDDDAAPLNLWAEDTPTDPLRPRLGNAPKATVHLWSVD